MSKNIERYTIWEIENESMNLDIILELLKKDYKQERLNTYKNMN